MERLRPGSLGLCAASALMVVSRFPFSQPYGDERNGANVIGVIVAK